MSPTHMAIRVASVETARTLLCGCEFGSAGPARLQGKRAAESEFSLLAAGSI